MPSGDNAGGCRPIRLKSWRRRDRCIVAHGRCMPAWQTAMLRGTPFWLVAERRGRINQQVEAAPWPSHPNLEQQAAECFEGASCAPRPWTCYRVFGKRSWMTRASRPSPRLTQDSRFPPAACAAGVAGHQPLFQSPMDRDMLERLADKHLQRLGGRRRHQEPHPAGVVARI